MPNLYSDNIIDEIREKCNIVEIISQYIPLKRAGRNYKAVCPFHHEKTPSFMVSPDKGIFHCFGCGAGGNVFNFIMKYEGLEFPQVLRMLAKKTGVKLPATSTFSKEQKTSGDLFQLNEMAASWFTNNLKKEIGQPAVGYLKKRAYQANTILKFRLGFAPDNNGLLNFMRARGVQDGLLEKAGLVIRRETGPYYDRFKQRIIFPIFDSRGRILAFGGRVLDNSMPKYMNSPETPIYNKGSHLYGLNFAKEEIKKQDFCIIVEGYIDLLTVHQSGIHNVVASLGTALTPHQIRLLKRFTHKVVVIFDADKAGEMASLRSLDLLIEEDVNVKVVSLPKGEDPDSYIRKSGKEEFWQKVVKSFDLFDYKLNLLSQSYDMDTTEGKVEIARHMLPTIHRVDNAIRKSAYVKRLAQEFSRGEKTLGEEWILTELRKVKRDFESYTKEEFTKVEIKAKRPAEEMLLRLSLEAEEMVVEIKRHLSLEDFQDLRIREAMRTVFRLHDKGELLNEAKLISCLASEDTACLISRICSLEKEFVNQHKSLIDCIGRIKADNLKERLNKLQRQIKVAQSWGHKDKIEVLVGEYNSLIKRRGKKT
ncbi:MAG: DNA primase [Candidatus Omnitrophica bacterium]|nr:DNA primase [Candidatus Omnitrophota bacterium]